MKRLSWIGAGLAILLLSGCGSTESTAGGSEVKPQNTEQVAAMIESHDESTEVVQESVVFFQNGSASTDCGSLTMVLEDGETALLESFPNLRKLNAAGSKCYLELFEYEDSHPDVVVKYVITLANGSTARRADKAVDLSGLSREDVEETIALLSGFTELESITLGKCPEETGSGDELTWEDVARFQEAFPETVIDYRFTLFGKEFSTADEQMILSHRKMDDNGAAVLEILPYMKNCTFLDMDSCGVDNEHMAVIRDAYPNIKVVWRVWFGVNDAYTCRTDVTRILASSEGRAIFDWCSEGLYYCTDVVHMDIGHNSLHDLSFLYNMPKLEVLILGPGQWSDATPIGSLENLEYLEVLSTNCTDISAFANLHNLKHLNIGNCWHITDITPLYGLTQLERLWIGCITPVPREQKEKIRELLTDTVINTEVANHKNGGWCKDETGHNVPRYALLREQFGDYQSSAYCYSWSDILYNKSIDELTEEEMAQIKP